MSRINYPADWSQSDRDDLDVMFNQARISGLWFFHGGMSGPLWFTPDELQAEQEKGKFVWGAVNWSLRSPTILLEQLTQKMESLDTEFRRVVERMGIKP